MNIEQFKNKKILVTGASGFVGKNLVEELTNLGFTNVLTPTSLELDMTVEESVKNYFEQNKPQVVLHIGLQFTGDAQLD